MRMLLLGAFAPAVLVAASTAVARPTRVDIPVQIEPNAWVYVQWVTVKAEAGRTIVSGYVRNKKWFAKKSGDLHVLFVKNGRSVACQETSWGRYRFHSRGQWRFSAEADFPALNIDSVRISHVVHDPGSEPSSLPNSCIGADPSVDPSHGGA
ncbi:hypothetical protein [Novosphingobium olei]|uniref:DUF995 domain-containing protein n=1 Tax=Novosphingobium olei TaxID=2728851 RepID=A0A7Y0GAV3_9SPHN|nr:hypothetical protein [Novosphingobium olei]NML94314.1 hypothetical protein [Novosphingobium olei]